MTLAPTGGAGGASSSAAVRLADVSGRRSPAPRTTVTFRATAAALEVVFDSVALPPLVVAVRRDGGPVFLDECVELFWSGARNDGLYLEVVANPAGAVYAARVENPDGSRATWSVSPIPPPEGLRVDVRLDPEGAAPEGARAWRCAMTVPWASLGEAAPPPAGSVRWANAFRISRGREGHRFLALSPTLRASPPDFHVPARFARLRFARLL